MFAVEISAWDKMEDELAEVKKQLVIAIGKAEGTYGLAKLDLENQIVEALEQLKKAKAREQKLVEALKFYADKKRYVTRNYDPKFKLVLADNGTKARTVLKEVKDG